MLSTFSTFANVLFQYKSPRAEGAKTDPPPGYTYEGTQTTAWILLETTPFEIPPAQVPEGSRMQARSGVHPRRIIIIITVITIITTIIIIIIINITSNN